MYVRFFIDPAHRTLYQGVFYVLTARVLPLVPSLIESGEVQEAREAYQLLAVLAKDDPLFWVQYVDEYIATAHTHSVGIVDTLVVWRALVPFVAGYMKKD